MWDKQTHTLTDQGKGTEEMAKVRISHTHTTEGEEIEKLANVRSC